MSEPQDSDPYLLGTGEAELQRLAFQHRVWGAQAYRLWERAGFRRGATLLDLGCGPGFATLDLAHLVGPGGRVIAADASRRYLDHLGRAREFHGLHWIEPVETDATALDLTSVTPPGASEESRGESFLDGAYCRWLLCYLDNPRAALAGVARALRVGGRLAVTDYFNYAAFTLSPRSDALSTIARAVVEIFHRSGGDLEIGSRLPSMLRAVGLRPVDIRQSVRTATPGSPLWAWPETFFAGFLPRLVEQGLVDSATEEAFWSDWKHRADDPDAFLSLPPQVEIIAEKR